MKLQVQYVTANKLPEYLLPVGCNQEKLATDLESMGYKRYNDFKIINTRGYGMKAVIRLIKAKIKKDDNVLEAIEDCIEQR